MLLFISDLLELMLSMIKSMPELFNEGIKMNIRPIKTKKDYYLALEKIESLFDAKPNTHDGDLLDILTTLVEAYEEKHCSC